MVFEVGVPVLVVEDLLRFVVLSTCVGKERGLIWLKKLINKFFFIRTKRTLKS